MANYKKLTDVEVMEEVSENTMALVEENGKLKKVPCGAGFGGGNKNDIIINYDEKTGECSCNTEYADFVDMFNERELPAVLCWVVDTNSFLHMYICQSMWLRQGAIYGLSFYESTDGGQWFQFNWDPSGVSINNEPL